MLPGSRCKWCKEKFTPEERARGIFLHSQCIFPYADFFAQKRHKQRLQEAKKLKAQETRQLRARKQAIKTIPQLIKEAQVAFNAYIRERDKEQPCICCGRPLENREVGGGFDCGHYRSTGSAPHLRFDERNAHGQTKHCNRWGAGRAVDYRLGLIARIGLEQVEALEASNEVHKWTKEELISIRQTYRDKLRQLRTPGTSQAGKCKS